MPRRILGWRPRAFSVASFGSRETACVLNRPNQDGMIDTDLDFVELLDLMLESANLGFDIPDRPLDNTVRLRGSDR